MKHCLFFGIPTLFLLLTEISQSSFLSKKRRLKSKKKVDDIKGFYWNLLSYCLVIPFLIFVNLMTSPGYHWFWWPMLGWGIGMVFHAYGVMLGVLATLHANACLYLIPKFIPNQVLTVLKVLSALSYTKPIRIESNIGVCSFGF